MERKPHNYWTEERCAQEAKRYKNRTAFFQSSASAFVIARNKGWLDKICSHMKLTPKQRKKMWNNCIFR